MTETIVLTFSKEAKTVFQAIPALVVAGYVGPDEVDELIQGFFDTGRWQEEPSAGTGSQP